MKKYKVAIQKGNGYFDPQLNVNINSPHGSTEITDEDIINNEVSNLNFAVRTGVLNMTDLDTGETVTPQEIKEQLSEKEVTEDNNEEEEIEVQEVEVEEETEEERAEEEEEKVYPTCQALTSTGERCSNRAVYPEDDPQYCHISSHQKEYNREEE